MHCGPGLWWLVILNSDVYTVAYYNGLGLVFFSYYYIGFEGLQVSAHAELPDYYEAMWVIGQTSVCDIGLII